MTPQIEGAGVELDYSEHGHGPAVVLVHGMASGARDWEPVIEALAGEARVIAYDRRGYGASGAPEPYERTTVNEQAEDAAALISGLDAAPAVGVGADLAALVLLDVLRRHPGLLAGAVLVDPPAFMLAPEATEALAAERLALEEALRDGGPRRAVELYLGWQGAGPQRTARAVEHAGAFFADYGGLATLPIARRDLRAVPTAVAVLDGPAAQSHHRAAADALARMLPGARRVPQGDVVGEVRALLAASRR